MVQLLPYYYSLSSYIRCNFPLYNNRYYLSPILSSKASSAYYSFYEDRNVVIPVEGTIRLAIIYNACRVGCWPFDCLFTMPVFTPKQKKCFLTTSPLGNTKYNIFIVLFRYIPIPYYLFLLHMDKFKGFYSPTQCYDISNIKRLLRGILSSLYNISIFIKSFCQHYL